jgi:hypothetical protein
VRRRRSFDPYRLSMRDRIGRRASAMRRRDIAVVAVVIAVALAIGGYLVFGGPSSATLHGWESGDHVGVAGRAAGSCASAYPPWAYLLSADEWIVCATKPGYACYRRRMHAMNFKPGPIRPNSFDANCGAALAVLRKARLLQ